MEKLETAVKAKMDSKTGIWSGTEGRIGLRIESVWCGGYKITLRRTWYLDNKRIAVNKLISIKEGGICHDGSKL